MRLLIALTVLECLLVVVVLVIALVAVARRLRNVSENLGRVAFGVRAVEKQLSAIGPAVTRVNAELEGFAGSLVAAVKHVDPERR